MYRLFKLHRTSKCSLPSLSCDTNNSLLGKSKVNGPLCNFCKLQHFNYASMRNQTMNSTPQKKGRKRTKNFTDVLVVRNDVSEQKTAVTKLKPKDLNLLILSDLSLDQFYKLRDLKRNMKVVMEHSYSDLTVIPKPVSEITFNEPPEEVSRVNVANLPKISIPPLSATIAPDIQVPETRYDEDEPSMELLHSMKPSLSKDAFQHHDEIEVDEPSPHHHHTTSIEYIEDSTDEMVNRTLSVYADICCFLQSPQRALNVILFHRNQVKREHMSKLPALKSVKVYNILLGGFAAKGDYERLQLVLKYMDEEGVTPNLHSFVAIFECLARVNVQDSHLKDIRVYMKQLFKCNITFDDLINKGRFVGEQRDLILTTIRSYDPNYVPLYRKPLLQYNNSLVDALNHRSQLEGLSVTDPAPKENLTFSHEFMHGRLRKQLQLEKLGYLTVKSIETKGEITPETRMYRDVLKEHTKMWEKEATAALARDLLSLNARKSILNIEPFMRCLPAKDYVTIIVEEAKKRAQGSETYSATTTRLHQDLGLKVYNRYLVLRKKRYGILDQLDKVHTAYCKHYANAMEELDVEPKAESDHLNTRQKWQWCEYKLKGDGASISNQPSVWFPFILKAVGKFLYKIIMHDIQIDVNAMKLNSKHKNYLPAFYTVFRHQARMMKEEVKPHPVLAKLYRASVCETLTFPANEVPMYCPPLPWKTVHVGGYLVLPCDLIRLPFTCIQQRQRMKETHINQLYPVMDALNEAAAVPWRVNERILDLLLEVFNAGGSARLEVPQHPNTLQKPTTMSSQHANKISRYTVYMQHLQYKRQKTEMYSLWCDCLYKLSLANHYRKDVFWLPHNIDFRGRVYPIPPHLHHLGADLSRALLIFAQSRPLGPHGLDWLKIHAINLTGLMKKEPVQARLQYANEIMDKILDSAARPLTGQMWWAESEDPWQTLACCMEIADAHRSPDPAQFRSHFPIHQDGSCNGLQHYAALGRDAAGARSVNLQNAHIPQDVYSAVVALVEQQRAADAAGGLEVAKVLDGFVRRKVIKQTIMTTVYGVTRFGARLQIARQLRDIGEFPREHVWAASHYLTARTFDSIRTMFTSTREIQDWFTECARMISAVSLRNVEWVTPLGLPVVQPYSKVRNIGTVTIYKSSQFDKYEVPNTMKQKNAFPPNFIHSLDSSHMMLTSLYCERKNVVFVSVHDCFWTHASTVPHMNEICRQQFVALHSEPILDNLSVFLCDKFAYPENELEPTDGHKRRLNSLILQLPKTGDFDIREVLDSVYFFS